MAGKYACLLLGCSYLLLAGTVNAITSFTYPSKASSACSLNNSIEDVEELQEVIGKIQQKLGSPGCNPHTNRSCKEILHCFPSAPSGYYQIHAANGSTVQVYCDMEGTYCGGVRGWTRVAYIRMTTPGAICPHGLTQKTFSELTLCGRCNPTGCQSTVFNTFDLHYSQVCGQLRGFQYGLPDAFTQSIDNTGLTIDDQYVDGVSITYGKSPRNHIWTYANGHISPVTIRFRCPCTTDFTYQLPSYVGNDYYCESAIGSEIDFKPNDPLWDGQDCTGNEGPCCTNTNQPWFHKSLDATTNEDIELRVCGNESPTGDEDTVLQVIELFIR